MREPEQRLPFFSCGHQLLRAHREEMDGGTCQSRVLWQMVRT
jgi:hypothetical protein